MSDNLGEIGLGLGAVDPLTGVSPEQGADWLRGAAKAYLDWRAGNQAEVENALMAGAGKSPNELMAGAGHVDLSNPLLMAFAGPGAIKGFHGTPHTFEPVEGNPFGEFKNEAVGTGEGAQAYGWGHYVAGNSETAETYQKTLSESVKLDNKPLRNWFNTEEFGRGGNRALNTLQEVGGDPVAAISQLEHLASVWGGPIKDNAIAARDLIADWSKNNRITAGEPGNLLEVHILPHEHELLDWDKPLGEQPTSIQSVLQHAFGGIADNMTGADIYRAITDNANLWPESVRNMSGRNWQQRASAALHSAGIPGIKYLDAGSRASGSGTYNYVIFDPSNLRIVARNGQRLEPVNHDPFAAQAGKLEDMRLTREGLIPDEFGNPNFFSNLLKKGSP